MTTSQPHLTAQRHLARRDPVLKQLIRQVGPCTLSHNPDHFGLLVRSIVAQQISTHAAKAISARLEKAAGRSGLTPRRILRLSNEVLRAAGLSAGKVRSLRDLATRAHSGDIPLESLPTLDDEGVIAALVPVHGIGRWTAQMFLIFSLGRLNVLPVDDYGLRAGIRNQYGLKELPKRKEIEELAEPWQPYCSIATWYIWRSLGNVPQSK